MGDFYELFFEDAEIASKALGMVLTKRGKHQGMDIPMCGVPVERSEDYLHRLINAGHRVAVCEQTENPAAARARGNKSVVARGVVRLVTPGTLTEDTLLDARTNNYLLAIGRARASAGGDRIGLAWIDISTSEFMVTECATAELAATLARINPNEAIVTDALYGDADLGPLLRELPSVTPLSRDVFERATAARRLFDDLPAVNMEVHVVIRRLVCTARAASDDGRTRGGAAPDMSRALARLSVGRGGPRDLAGLRDGILAADQALARLAQLEAPPTEIIAVMEALRRPSRDLAREFERALAEQLPLIKRDGGFIRENY